MKRIESFRWWINDYVTSTVRRRCSLEARGLYLDVLMLLYGSPRPGYACEAVNGGVVYLSADEILTDVGAAGEADLFGELVKWGGLSQDDDGWHNPKAVEVAENEIDFRAKKAAAGSKGGKARARNLAESKQRSSTASSDAGSTASSKRVAEGQANTLAKPKPPDPDPDPESVSDPEPDPGPQKELSSPLPVPKEPGTLNEQCNAVIAHWREAFKHPSYKSDMGDLVTIQNAIKIGWSVDDLKTCITGYTRDRWQGRKKMNAHNLDVLLRDSKHIEAGIEMAEKAAELDEALSASRSRDSERKPDESFPI